MSICWTRLFLIGLFIAKALAQSGGGREHATQIASTLPQDSFLRHSIEGGRLGDGVEQPWQTEMKQCGVRAARIEVSLIWFFGPRNLTPVRVVYYGSYDGEQQITDSATLARFKASGLEAKLRAEAIRRAPDAHWVDLPFFAFWPFKAATAVTVWDDPWLPNLPHMFTTFGPGRPPLVAAIGFGDLADTDRLLASGNINKKSLNKALWYSCSHQNPQIRSASLKLGQMLIKSTHGRSSEHV